MRIDRIYLIKLVPEASSITPRNLIDLARNNNYSKIFAKIPECHSDILIVESFFTHIFRYKLL